MTAAHGFTAIVGLFALGGALEAGIHPVAVATFVLVVILMVWLALCLWITHTDVREQRMADEIVRRTGRQVRGRT